MRFLIFFLPVFLISCSFDVSGLSGNNNNNSNNNNSCAGDAPLADLQNGVCEDSVKVCINGTWEEPDYSQIENFESNETKCDSLDNDCDGVVDAGNCGFHSSCGFQNDTLGCYCDMGYQDQGDICEDINECDADPCDINATCTNLDGNYSCKCNDGYEGDGFSCTEIDECLTNPCHNDAICIDHVNSFECHCKQGYEGDGIIACYPKSCKILHDNHPLLTSDGTFTIDTGTGGPLDVFCDMTSDFHTGYTMVKFSDSNLGNNQTDYRNLCASYGMEVIVPRTRAHARAIRNWLGGNYPSLVNVFPQFDGATGLENFQGLCNGAPCSFYLSDNRYSYSPTSEPNGDNSTLFSLYLKYDDAGNWGGWNDQNNEVDSSFSGSVVCSTNDNPDPPVLRDCYEYVKSNTVWNKSAYGISGVYEISPTGNATDITDAYCDQRMDGGGWTLVLNYVHKGGTNPALNIKTDSLPLWGANSLGTDESASPIYWGHASNSYLSKFTISEIRFYGRGDSGRIIDFTTADSGCIDYFQTGTGHCSTFMSDNFHGLPSQNAYLPQNMDSFFVDKGDLAMTEYPFYMDGNFHWGIKGRGSRWEMDDYPNNDSENTIHRVFVRSKPAGTSCLNILTNYPGSKSGYYSIDPDGTGGNSPFITYCEMVRSGGGWTLVALYGGGFGRPTKWHGSSYPRPGASFFNSDTMGPTMDKLVLNANYNDGNFANSSIDASQLWANSNHEVLAYVGGPTDDYITAMLPAGCNYFDSDTWCIENTFGPFTIYLSNGSIITANGYACTTAHGNTPYTSDPYNEFGLHIQDGFDILSTLNCANTASTVGSQDLGRIFTTFESSDGGYWNGVTSSWDENGTLYQPGALFIR